MNKIVDIHWLAKHLHDKFLQRKIVCTSGGYSIVHAGHTRCLEESRLFHDAVVVVIVNGDDFLVRKKGYALVPLAQRQEVVAAMSGVDWVVGWDDGSQNVAGALRLLKPGFFTKGGDRSSPAAMDEKELLVCAEVGCKVVYGVGGFAKVESSTSLTERLIKGEVLNGRRPV